MIISQNDNISNDNISLVYCTTSKDIVLSTRTWNAYLLSLYRRKLGVKLTQNWKEHAKNVPTRLYSVLASRPITHSLILCKATLEIADGRALHCLLTLKIPENVLETVFFFSLKTRKEKEHPLSSQHRMFSHSCKCSNLIGTQPSNSWKIHSAPFLNFFNQAIFDSILLERSARRVIIHWMKKSTSKSLHSSVEVHLRFPSVE